MRGICFSVGGWTRWPAVGRGSRPLGKQVSTRAAMHSKVGSAGEPGRLGDRGLESAYPSWG